MDASLLSIQPNAVEPLYRQITGQIRRLVAGGVLRPGEALPSVRDVAGLHAINPMTVSKAYSQLEAEGVLLRLRGKGMVVADLTAPPDLAARWILIDPALDALARQARELELPVGTLLDRLKTRLTEDPQ
ncbi:MULTISPECIES: GntR family transcriptional regulator [Luteimonas]|uniref:GntR family transcriptional regulator n=1 Tax=Luteimonas TaxID=83614 RepID=UPI000C7B2754|nr:MULTISPECIES: GntR family transcriptional regulator [Luteimonas]